ncbi:MAG: biotin--[acetyl-CoA-carboxylase] ligase [Actinomycetaceae bacterium]|nr:biotin--[acetyl-CoA-carboxylase] ligase [Actinomycetaceae bacterium]
MTQEKNSESREATPGLAQALASGINAGPGALTRYVLSTNAVPAFIHVDSTTSTNDVSSRLWHDYRTIIPSFMTVVADEQTEARGRLGRSWETLPGKSLAASTIITLPEAPHLKDSSAWLTLIAGLALKKALNSVYTQHGLSTDNIELIWPNDIHIQGKKVAGILGELLDSYDGWLACVIGVGINLGHKENELPVEGSTSLVLQDLPFVPLDGATKDRPSTADSLLAAYLHELRQAVGTFITAGLHQDLTREMSQACATIGRAVCVQRVDGSLLEGVAQGISPSGALEIRDANGVVHPVMSGDVSLKS